MACSPEPTEVFYFMTIENNEFFEFIAANGFKQKVYKTSRGSIIMDWSNPYNIRSDYRGYHHRHLYIELDFEFLTIYNGNKKLFRCLLSDKPGWGNEAAINYLHIPAEIIYFITHKHPLPIPPKPKNRYIPKSLRQLIFELFNYKCNFCGSADCLEIDHIFPFSKGGKSVKENLQLLCKPCNRKKFNKTP